MSEVTDLVVIEKQNAMAVFTPALSHREREKGHYSASRRSTDGAK